MILASNLFASVMFAAGCALLTAILLRRTYRKIGRSRSRNEGPIAKQPRPTSQWSGAYTDAAARFEREKVEMHELARELRAQLDSKMLVLQELIKQSDQQIERLEQLLEESRRG